MPPADFLSRPALGPIASMKFCALAFAGALCLLGYTPAHAQTYSDVQLNPSESQASPVAASAGPREAGPALAATQADGLAAIAASTPRWIDLTLAQQDALMPLAGTWSSLPFNQKRKWMTLVQNFPLLSRTDQAKLHSRMAEWAALNPAQRELARLNFAVSKNLSAADRAATWEAYKALSPQERQKLAARAAAKPTGAAAMIKPAAGQNLSTTPNVQRKPLQLRDLVFSRQAIDRNTLLPLAPSAAPATTPAKN